MIIPKLKDKGLEISIKRVHSFVLFTFYDGVHLQGLRMLALVGVCATLLSMLSIELAAVEVEGIGLTLA